MIGKLNQEVRFCVFTPALSDNNTPIVNFDACFVEWVNIEQLSASRGLEQSQITFTKAYKITKRHYEDRQIDTALTQIEYGANMLSIHSLRLKTEGRRVFEELICYANNSTI